MYRECCNPSNDSFSMQRKIFGFFGINTYCFSLTFVYLVFASRIVAAFEGSVWSLTHKQVRWLKLIFIVQISFNMASASIYFINTRLAMIFMALSLVK